jgi:hypothetical protein
MVSSAHHVFIVDTGGVPPGTDMVSGFFVERWVPVAAIVAAVLFGLALLFQLLNISISVITATVLITAGLLCVALHLAGVGSTVRVRGYSRRR